jgi:hypothetical protein
LPKVPKLKFVEKAVGRDLIKKSFQSYNPYSGKKLK